MHSNVASFLFYKQPFYSNFVLTFELIHMFLSFSFFHISSYLDNLNNDVIEKDRNRCVLLIALFIKCYRYLLIVGSFKYTEY